jgi:hypothetical protein
MHSKLNGCAVVRFQSRGNAPQRLRLAVLAFAITLCVPFSLAQSATVTSLAISSGGSVVNTAKEGTAVTLTATVTLAGGAAAAPPGQASFCEVKPAPLRCTDIRLLGTVQLSAAGTAVLNIVPGPGIHTYQAIFLGTHAEAASSSNNASLTVSSDYPTTTTITNISIPSAGTYTVNVTVTGNGGAVAPTGTVSILDTSNANYVLGTSTPLIPSGATSGLLFSDTVTPSATPGWNDSIAAADFNGDGKLDVIVGWEVEPSPPPLLWAPCPWTSAAAECPSPAVFLQSVLLGNGDGTLGQPLPLPVAAVGAIADFNGDGKLDLVVPSGGTNGLSSSNLQVMLGNGDGTFRAGPTASTAFGNFTAAGDFNGDGIEDLAVANAAAGTLTILLGNGDGSFRTGSNPQAGVYPLAIAVGDFDGDGILDLAVLSGGVNGTGLGSVMILRGHGDGTFAQVGSALPTWQVPTAIVTADLNGDGHLDLAVANDHGASANQLGAISILLGNGDGTFTPTAGEIGPPNHFPGFDSLAAADFNGDGKADLVANTGVFGAPLATFTGIVSVLIGYGDGTFEPINNPAVSGSAYEIVPGDFNNDGLSGIAAANYDPLSQRNSELVNVLSPELSTETATATVSDFFVVGPGLHDIVASYPGDNNYQPSVSAGEGVTGEPEPSTMTLTANPATTEYGQQVLLTATISPDPAQNHTATGTVTFMNGSTVIGTGALANGVATLNTTSLPLGADSLTATYPGDTNFTPASASATETVNGYASTTTLLVAPNPANASQVVTLTATVIGNPSAMSAPTGLVTFYDGLAQIGQMAVDGNGHAIYPTSSLAIGTHMLTASYAGAAIYYGSKSAAVAVTINPFLSVTTLSAAPNPAGVGQKLTLTATVTGFNSAIPPVGTVTFSNGAIPLGQGTIVPGSAASGIATFATSALPLGTYSLTAIYAGGGVYAASSSQPLSEQIVTPDFAIALSSPSLTLEKYHHTTISVTLQSIGGFADSMALSCANQPQYVTCIFTPSPAALASSGAATVSLYIDTSSVLGIAASTGPTMRRGLPPGLALLCLPLGFLAGVNVRRRRRGWLWAAVLPAAILPFAMALSGCGANVIVPVPAATPGAYSIPITAVGTSSGLTHSALLTLNVTP